MATRPARGSKNVRILYIEDNRENRMLVRAILEAEGYTIADAEDGLSGIEAAIREQPDLILLDINLPGVDGYEVVAILKSFPNIATTPVIALTAYAMEGDRQRTLVAGCDGYIQKPIDVDAFPRQIAEFMRGKREHVEEREEGVYLRELNQRLVYRLVNQVEELKRLNQHFVRRAGQLAELHRAVQDITSDVGISDLLEKLLPQIARALGTTALSVELSDPAGVRIAVTGDASERPRSVLSGAAETVEDWVEVEWSLPLVARGHQVGTMTARHVLPPGAKADEEQLLNIVANQVAIAVENSRLYGRVTHRASEQEGLVTAGRLITGTLQVSEVLGRLAELVRGRLGGIVRIWLRDAATGELSLSAQAGETRTKGGDEVAPSRALARWILEQRVPLIVPHLLADARITNRGWITAEGVVAYLGVPLFLEDEAVGILSVLTHEPRAFASDEVAFAEALATSAAAAIKNARSYEETQTQLRNTETFLSVSQALGSTLELTEVLRRTVRAMARAVGADTGGAWLLSKDSDRFVPLVGYHVPKELVETFGGTPISADHPLFERAKKLEGPIFAHDSQSDPRFDHPLSRLIPHQSLLIQPIWLKGENIGGFALAWMREAHAVTPDELRMIEGITRQAAVAVENARLLEAEHKRLEESQTLLSVSQAVSSTLDLTEMMRRVAKATAGALGAEMVGAYLADADRQLLRPIAGYRVPSHLRGDEPIPLAGHRFIEEAWASKQPTTTLESSTDPRVDHASLARFAPRSLVFVPMIVKGAPIGGLFAVWWQRAYTPSPEELRLVEGIANQAAVAIDNSRLYEGVKRQMAELKQTQAQLIQSTKLAAIGELAANIAHEINNPLTTVLGFASFLAEKLEPGAPTLDELTLIQEEATRARDIVRDLLQFSRQSDFLPAMTDISVIVDQVVGMVRRQGAVDTVDVQESYGTNLPLVEIDISRIKQVFLNIINNAIYAMPEGGTLTIKTLARDGFLHVEFADTGMGIEPENLARIFDPFFTTKPDVSGTGLGLSVSLGIVQSHGGTIEVESTLGKGSTFRIKLPTEPKPTGIFAD